MSPQITYRAFQKQDTNALEKIVYDTWQYEQFGKQKTGRRLAKLYLASCLANQTYTQVALADGVPVGIVMGKNIKTYRPSLRSRFQLFWQGLPLLFSAEGRAGMKEYQKLEHIYDEMI